MAEQADRTREKGGLAVDTAPPGKDGEGSALAGEPETIARHALEVGTERLDRSNLDIFVTGAIGGTEVSFGAIAAMSVLGAFQASPPLLPYQAAVTVASLVYPIGLLFVILGRSELFTENFLIPVFSVFEGRRSVRSLIDLWVVSWLGNLVGCGILAFILTRSDAVAPGILDGYRAYSSYKLEAPLWGVFYSAIIAGLVMTALTWVLLSLRDTVGDMLAIFAGGYLLFVANLAHCIVGASVLFVALGTGSANAADVLRWISVATIGNLVGGVGSVTFYRFVQARIREHSS